MKWTVGIDEVGRGALAGPVFVAAAAIRYPAKIANRSLGKLKDSKKLSPKRREAWFVYLKDHPAVRFSIARVYPREIERRNISRAANIAAERAFLRLRTAHALPTDTDIYLDGGLFVGLHDQPR